MELKELRSLNSRKVNKIRAEVESLLDFPFQIAHINLDDEKDPSAILEKNDASLTIITDKHSYSNKDRIFPVNQDENTIFSQYVYQDSVKVKYKRVLDLCTGSGVIAMSSAKANAEEVIASDVNPRCKEFIDKNNEVNNVKVKFVKSDLFKNIKGRFEKITMNPPFMPSPKNVFPLHAQGGPFGTDYVVEPFFKECWKFVNKGGCIQAIFQSFASDNEDSILHIIEKDLPEGWSYEIKHVFPVKNIPIELYTSAFAEQKNYSEWIEEINKRKYRYMRFFMITIRNDGKNGLQKEELSKPRLYNLIYPPTVLKYLSEYNLKTKLMENPVSENEFPIIGHLMRLSRYNYFVYLNLYNLFS